MPLQLVIYWYNTQSGVSWIHSPSAGSLHSIVHLCKFSSQELRLPALTPVYGVVKRLHHGSIGHLQGLIKPCFPHHSCALYERSYIRPEVDYDIYKQ